MVMKYNQCAGDILKSLKRCFTKLDIVRTDRGYLPELKHLTSHILQLTKTYQLQLRLSEPHCHR